MTHQPNRRNLLKIGMRAAGLTSAFTPLSTAWAAICGPTPPQTLGPFYPGDKEFSLENDLTILRGKTERAEGQVIYVKGKVVDQHCQALAHANVEIWQACASGRYKDTKDHNPAPLDPHFKYWAETFTDAHGDYWFKTIVPGAYPADAGWMRPPHIHFRVSCPGYQELVTQMYFQESPLNAGDLILQALEPEQRDALIVDFQPATPELEPGSKMGLFNITLTPLR